MAVDVLIRLAHLSDAHKRISAKGQMSFCSLVVMALMSALPASSLLLAAVINAVLVVAFVVYLRPRQ